MKVILNVVMQYKLSGHVNDEIVKRLALSVKSLKYLRNEEYGPRIDKTFSLLIQNKLDEAIKEMRDIILSFYGGHD